MNAFHLKLIALITMLIDHVGLFFFPDLYWMRMVGRLSFILFAFLIANGAMYTKNLPLYFTRLTAFALLSQLPYTLTHQYIDPAYFGLNIFATLAAGLLAIMLWRTNLLLPAKLLAIASIAFLAEILLFSYGAYGVLTVVLFYIFYKKPLLLSLTQAVSVVALNTIPFILEGGLSDPYLLYMIKFIQPLGLLALPLIFLYNGQKGRGLKIFFYTFYPLHLLVIYWVLLVLDT